MEATIEEWRSYATICRLCLQRDGFMLGIFNHIRGKERSIYKKIMDCTDLQIADGDGLPACICHRCLFKIELCLEFKQQCTLSDATLRQINGLPMKPAVDPAPIIHEQPPPPPPPPTDDVDNVVMVVDPLVLDYDSEYDSDNEPPSDVENTDLNDTSCDFRNVFMCKYCDQAFTQKTDCVLHETASHNPTVPYTCTECDRGFADRGQFSAHLKSVHQNDKPYNCPQCSRTFARRSDLRKHTVVHTGVKPFSCNICFKSFSRNTNLSKHMRIHSGQKPFVCPKCPKTFISKGDLTRHAIIHSGQKPFACNYCPLTFGRRDKLLRHEKRHFPQNVQEDRSQELEMMRQSLAMTDFGYGAIKREEQQKAAVAAENWTNHSENMVISVDPFGHETTPTRPPLAAEDAESNPSQASTADTGEEETTTAAVAASSPKREENLDVKTEENIAATVTDDTEPDPPPSPEKTLAEKRLINFHKIKRYPCLRCNKRFSGPEGLRVHMTMHAGDRPHNCAVCHKAFVRKRELDRHMGTHTGMKPYKCASCDKRFGRKDKLVRHARIHGDRDHVCVLCGATFNRKDGLAHHMRTHQKDSDMTSMMLGGGV